MPINRPPLKHPIARWLAAPLAASLLLTAVPAAWAQAEPLQRARQLVEQREYGAALGVYQTLLSLKPNDSDLLIETARVLGFADRNAEAAQHYRRVIEVAPQRRADVVLPLAWQTLWAGQAEEARALFSEAHTLSIAPAEAQRGLGDAATDLGDNAAALAHYRAALALAPTDLAARRGEARSLLWLDRHDEAARAYALLLAERPEDRGAAVGYAQTFNYSGRHRRAVAEFEKLLPTQDEGILIGLAQAERWAGFDDLAARRLASLDDNEAVWLRDFRVGRELRHTVYAGWEGSEDADEQRVSAPSAGLGWRIDGRGTLRLDLRAPRITGHDLAAGRRIADTPRETVNGTELLASYDFRLGDLRSPWGTLWPSVSIGRRSYGGWDSFAWRLRAAWQPRDLWRVGLDAGNEIVETIGALKENVSLRGITASVGFRPQPRWDLYGGAAALRFDDGNTRQRLFWRTDYAVWLQPRILLGYEGQAYDNSKPEIRRGYYNPEDYLEQRLFAALSYELRPWEFYLKLGAGPIRETDADGNRSRSSSGLWEAWAAYDASKDIRLRIHAGGTSGQYGVGGTGSAYWRRYAGVTAQFWF